MVVDFVANEALRVAYNSYKKVVKMKGKLYQRIFDRKSHESAPSTRRLSLESLENRAMLNADWSGFGAENTTVFTPETTDSYSVDLKGETIDVCKFADLDGDSRDELITVDYATQKVYVYANTVSDGEFKLRSSQKLDSLNSWKSGQAITICDFNGDGNEDLMVVSSSDGFGLTAATYTWNNSTSSFQLTASKSLDVAPFANLFVFSDVAATTIGDSGECSLVVQGSYLTTSGTVLSTTVVYSGVGTSSFGTKSSAKGAITESLLGSTRIDGTDYLLLRDATATSNDLVLASFNSKTGSVEKTYYDLSAYGAALTFQWVVEHDGFLALGARCGTQSGLITIKATKPTGDVVDASTLGQWIGSGNVKFTSTSSAVIGNIGGDADPEIWVVNGSSSTFFLGEGSTKYQYAFTEESFVVSSPEYCSVYVGDYNNDGVQDGIFVGEDYAFVAKVDAEGNVSDLTKSYRFTQPVKKAVFGDFNGDGRLDFAVQYRATTGSGLQVFQQLSDGSFVALATQSFKDALIDIAVGKFSQTDVDEIAVLHTSLSSASLYSTVDTFKLGSIGSVLTSTRTAILSGVYASALTSGKLYGSALDDLVTVNSTQDTTTVLKNTGSSFSSSTVTTSYDGASGVAPVAAAIGDFNGDGLADLAVVNSASGTNYANLVYYLRTEDGGLGVKPTGKISVNATAEVAGLYANDLNSDGLADLVLMRKGTDGVSYLNSYVANGAASVFASAVTSRISADAASNVGVTFACVDSGNVSADFVWAQDKTIGVLLNGDATVAAGSVQFVCNGVSTDVSASLSDALKTQRTWLDEWSHFYVEVWATTDGQGAVTNVTSSFAFDSDYFVVSGFESGSGFFTDYTVQNGVVTTTSFGSAAADADGWTYVGRIQFEPVVNGGLAIPTDGVMRVYDPGFAASASAQTINGGAAASVSVPSVELYPFAFDVNDNGEVDLEEFTLFVNYLSMDVSSIDVSKHRILDVNGNGEFDLEEFTVGLAVFASSYDLSIDQAYQTKPVAKSLSNAVLAEEDELDFFAPELAQAEQVVANSIVQRSAKPVYGPLPYDADLDADLDVDWNAFF